LVVTTRGRGHKAYESTGFSSAAKSISQPMSVFDIVTLDG
jgi:hypothetical protein